MRDTEFRGHGLGGPATVAREHHDRQPGVSQLFECLWSGLLNRVGHTDHPNQSSISGDEHDRLTLAAELVRPCEHRTSIDPELAHEGNVSERHRPAVDARNDAFPGDGPEILGGGGLDATCLRTFYDRRRQRMLAADFDAR